MEASKGIEQAEVMRRWYEQRSLPKDLQDILEVRYRPRGGWITEDAPTWNFAMCDYRLRTRPQKKTVTVYLYRVSHTLVPSLTSTEDYTLLGQADITYEEPQNDS